MRYEEVWYDFFEDFLDNTEYGPLYEGTPCLLWQGATTPKGYGVIKVGGRKGKVLYLHRLSYEKHNLTAIPARTDVHHRCEHKNCFNPDHLEAERHHLHSKRHNPKGGKKHGR